MDHHADVVVVGAGPAGATPAPDIAYPGISVALLEKVSVPREQGDPQILRAVKRMIAGGVVIRARAARVSSEGLGFSGVRTRELTWPGSSNVPTDDVVGPRARSDEVLVRLAPTV
jgi:flavin-dependent dehydrogenase